MLPKSKTDNAITLTRVLLSTAQWPVLREQPFSMKDPDGGLYDNCMIASYCRSFLHDGTTIIEDIKVLFTSGPTAG